MLARAVEEYDIKLHAYCLMVNHVHLLVQDDMQKLSAFMKQMSETYAMYFGKETGRVGRVFQRPFWSEPIESDAYFLNTVRYIHSNPEPAGICRTTDYPWSSYQSYLSGSPFVETSLVCEMLGGVRRFEEFSALGGCYAKPFEGSKLTGHHSYDELVNIAVALLGRDGLNSLRTMPSDERRLGVELLSGKGFSNVEISRLTGIGYRSICRILA